MRIAYIGPAWGTSSQRMRALERLGHEVYSIDPTTWFSWPKGRAKLHLYTSYVGLDSLIGPRLMKETLRISPQLIWINQLEYLGPGIIKKIRKLGVPIINYANDNPFSRENWLRFRPYRSALPYYDLVVVVFAAAVQAARRAGARRVLRTYLCADELAHSAELGGQSADRDHQSEVAFVGTWMKAQRGPFMAELIERGVPVSIWGDRWQKAKEWPVIKSHWRGPGVYSDDGYARLIRSAKICLGLLNKRSENLHTGRSIQIPALGGLLCAERTPEHQVLYTDGEEAVFWDSAEECAQLCLNLLNNEEKRREIARRGHERALKNNLFNEPILASILEAAIAPADHPEIEILNHFGNASTSGEMGSSR